MVLTRLTRIYLNEIHSAFDRRVRYSVRKNTFQCTWNVLFCMMITEVTFFLSSLKLCIAVKITTPYFLQIQIIKFMSNNLTNCFQYMTLTPIWNSYPVTNLHLSLYHSQNQSSILCYTLAALFLLKLRRISQVLKKHFL